MFVGRIVANIWMYYYPVSVVKNQKLKPCSKRIGLENAMHLHQKADLLLTLKTSFFNIHFINIY